MCAILLQSTPQDHVCNGCVMTTSTRGKRRGEWENARCVREGAGENLRQESKGGY